VVSTSGEKFMTATLKLALGSLAAATVLVSAVSARAGADEAPKFAYSFNIGATNNYIFRGVAQNKENPSVQGGLDLTYGIGYFGLWASNVDFGNNFNAAGNVASRQVTTEIDIYGGIKPVVGPATFDLGVIYYAYPGANDGGLAKLQIEKQDYVEFKGGVSGAFLPALPKLTLGGVVFFSPEYQGKQGEVWTVEGNAAYELPAVGPVTPTISGLIGGQYGDSASNKIGNLAVGKFNLANGKDELIYWNVGLTLAVEKFTFDFRYWNTDIANGPAPVKSAGFCTGTLLQCDGQFVFLGKFTY
jgi:uncharacterized protein (TIGR02001 family)